MSSFNHIFKQDYDKRIKVGDNYVFCYSKKKLKELYPDGKGYSLCGEAWRGTGQSQDKYDEKQRKRLEKLKESGKADKEKSTLKIGDLQIGGQVISVYPEGTNEPVLSKADGYVCIDDGKFIAIHSSRVPFLLTVGGIFAATVAVVAIIIALLLNPEPPWLSIPIIRCPCLIQILFPLRTIQAKRSTRRTAVAP